MNKEQFERLPKYARYEIQRLRIDVEHYRDVLAEMDAGQSDTKIARYNDDDIYLPSGSRISFYGDDGVIHVTVKQYGHGQNEKGYTVIEATSAAMGQGIKIEPLSSNMVRLGTIDT